MSKREGAEDNLQDMLDMSVECVEPCRDKQEVVDGQCPETATHGAPCADMVHEYYSLRKAIKPSYLGHVSKSAARFYSLLQGAAIARAMMWHITNMNVAMQQHKQVTNRRHDGSASPAAACVRNDTFGHIRLQ